MLVISEQCTFMGRATFAIGAAVHLILKLIGEHAESVMIFVFGPMQVKCVGS